MVTKTFNINLDLRRVTAQAESIPPLVEGDNGNIFVITLTNDGTPVDLSGCRVLCVFSKTDGSTVEQDTEDAYIALEDYGLSVTGTAIADDAFTVDKSGGSYSVTLDATGITAASVDDADAFDSRCPDDGSYVFTYDGTSWVLGSNSVVVSGTNHNIVTVNLKTASFGIGKNNCELQIYSGDTLVTTAQFNFDARKGIINEETIRSEDKYPLLLSLIAQAQDALARAMPFTSVSASASTLTPSDPATASATKNADNVVFSFGIPKGDTGLAEKVYIKYAADQPTADADMGDTPNNWIGFSVTTNNTAPTHYTDYLWYRIRGDQGIQGNADHMYIKWSATSPTSDADMKGTVDKYIGIHVSTATSAPAHYTDYTWYQYKGDTGNTGATGDGIASITWTSGDHSAGSTDTYTITMTSGATATFTVYNGANGTNGTNGVGIVSIVQTAGDHSAGTTDTYTVTLSDGTSYDFTVYNGADGAGQVTSVNNKTGAVTLTATDVGAVPTTRTVNNKALSADITLTASDVGAASSTDVTNITEMKLTSGWTLGSSWTSNAHQTDTNSVFPYRKTVAYAGITASMFAEVVFGVKDAISGNFSPVCETYAGGVYIYSKQNSSNPTIKSILVHK